MVRVFRVLMKELGMDVKQAIMVMQDNQAAILNFEKGFRGKTRPLNIRYHYVRELYERRILAFLKVHTGDMMADPMTKPFSSPTQDLPLLRRLLNFK